MADKVVDVLRSKYLISPISYSGLERKETLEIPEDSLRELIFNSIIHKDYMGVHIQMKVFNDYIWLWNEGKLPHNLPIEELMLSHASHPRNRIIATVFYKAGFIESWGRGISKVAQGFTEAGLPIPKFESAFGGVLVTIPRLERVSNSINAVSEGVNSISEGVNNTNEGAKDK